MTNNFDGKKFYNLNRTKQGQNFKALLKWLFTRNKSIWPKYVPNEYSDIPPDFINDGTIRISFIGHATFLIQTDGLNIITDPVFSDRAAFAKFFGPKRVAKPGIDIESLPKIDMVLVSHNHYDHLDIKSLKYLAKKDNPLMILPIGNEKIMAKISDNTKFLSWGEPYKNICFEPSQHWSSRTPFDRNKSLWGSFIIKAKAGNICFIGDTGYDEALFKKIGSKYSGMKISIIPIGSYEPRWFMKDIHVNPEEAVKIHVDLNTKLSIASHFATFQLSDESYEKPVEDLKKALNMHGMTTNDFVAMKNGQYIIV
jgi:L-ascorbate metabolism protein UlaG (beta-lactamase superfamily)